MPDIDLTRRGIQCHRVPGPELTQFQVLGERGSGTNVVRRTLELNFDLLRVNGLGWKHGFPSMVAIPADLLVVCVVRNAAAWALSMHRRPWHADPALQALPFAEFIRSEWRSIVDRPADFEMLTDELNAQGAPLQLDRHPLTGRAFPNLFALRRAKLEGLTSIGRRECSFAFLQFEVFVADPEAVIERIGAAFGLRRKTAEFRQVRRRLGHRFNRSVTVPPPTPSDFPASDLDFLRSHVDLEAEARLGYRYD